METQKKRVGKLHDRVLHVMYHSSSDLPAALLQLANDYEGAIPHRVGWNLPITPSVLPTLTALYPDLMTHKEPPVYLIVYPAKDIQTKKHELLHARYAMDPDYRRQVRALWDGLSPKEQKRVYRTLRELQYPDREELLLDEFQAYYFTEPPRFFGLPPLPSLPPSNKRRK